MEMKTPTRADDLAAVSESTPAQPASSAMMNDYASGLTMNWVCGPVVAAAKSTKPAA